MIAQDSQVEHRVPLSAVGRRRQDGKPTDRPAKHPGPSQTAEQAAHDRRSTTAVPRA